MISLTIYNIYIMSDKIKTKKKDKGLIESILGTGADIVSLILFLMKKKN